MNFLDLMKTNEEPLRTWIYQVRALKNAVELNDLHGRFIKSELDTDFFEHEFRNSLTECDLSDDSLNSTGYDLIILGDKISFKGGNKKVLGRRDKIKNTQGNAQTIEFKCSFDYLLSYSKDVPMIGILSHDYVKENVKYSAGSWDLKMPKDRNLYEFFIEFEDRDIYFPILSIRNEKKLFAKNIKDCLREIPNL